MKMIKRLLRKVKKNLMRILPLFIAVTIITSLLLFKWNKNESFADTTYSSSQLPIGSYINFGKLGSLNLVWRVCGYGTDCSSDNTKGGAFLVLENWTDTYANYPRLPFDPPHTGDPSEKYVNDLNPYGVGRNEYGTSNWRNSTMRYWLNSDDVAANINNTHHHEYYDVDLVYSSNPYGKDGFLHDFTEDEKNAIQLTRHKNAITHVTIWENCDIEDEGTSPFDWNASKALTSIPASYDYSYVQYTEDKVFCMNIKELINAKNNTLGNNYCGAYNYFLRDSAGHDRGSGSPYSILFVSNHNLFTDNIAGAKACYTNESASFNVLFALRPALILDPSKNFVATATPGYYELSPQIDLSSGTVTGVLDKTYIGSENKQSGYSVSYGGVTLTENTDYTVSYSEDTTNAGGASIVFSGIGGYCGSITKTYQIEKAAISIDASGYTGITKEYDGNNTALFGGNTSVSKTLSGVGGEILNFTLTGTYDSASIDVGTNKTVTYALASFDSVTGGNANKNNYTLTLDATKNATTNNSITEKVITVDLSGEVASKTYDGDNKVKWSGSETKAMQVNGVNSEVIDYTISGTYAASSAGTGLTATYTINSDSITVTGGRGLVSNYSLQIESSKNVNSSSSISTLSISDSNFTISDLNNEIYTGSPITKTITSTLGDGDYTIGYESNTNVGTATIIITGQGNYTGTITKEFTITQKEIDVSDITIAVEDSGYVYCGSAYEPDVSNVIVTAGGVTLSSSDFEITNYEDNTNATTETLKAKVTLNLKGNYTSNSVTGEFEIKPLSMTENTDFTVDEITETLVYDGSAKTPSSIIVKWKGNELTLTSDYTITISNNINAGEDAGVITVTGCGNFEGSFISNFTISPRDITSNDDITISNIEDQEYRPSQIKPEYSISDEGILSSGNPTVLVLNTDFTENYGDNNEIGDDAGSIIITGKGNYTGSKTFTFNIIGVSVDEDDVEVIIDDSSLVYDGSAKTPSYTVKVKGEEITNSDYEFVGWNNNTNATTETSKASLVIRLKNHYSSANDITTQFNISPLSITANGDIDMPSVNDDGFIYTGSSLTPAGLEVVWKTSITLTLNEDYTIVISNNVDAGTGKVTITGTGNFAGTKEFNFDIARRDLSSDCTIVSLINDEEVQGGLQIKPETFTVKDSSNNNRELVKGYDYSIKSYGTNTDIGPNNGSIVIEGGGNYKGTVTLYFNIVAEKVDLSKITATLDSTNVFFDGTPQTPSDKITVSYNGTPLTKDVGWEVINGSWENNTNAGNAAKVKIKLIGSYSSDPKEITFSINPKVLSASDFEFTGTKISKEITKKSDYNNSVPSAKFGDLEISLKTDGDVTLSFTSAIFKDVTTTDDPMKLDEDLDITISGLSISNTNYVLSPSFTSFDAEDAGQIVDRISPELLTDFVTIADGTYKTGNTIYIELNFDKDISKSGTNPVLEFYSNVLSDGKIGTLNTNKYKVNANFDSINENKVKFKYVVSEGDYLPNGFTFALFGLSNQTSLVDAKGNIVSIDTQTKRFDDVIILSKTGVLEDLINLINGNDNDKETKIFNLLKDNDKTDLIFDGDYATLNDKLGSSAPDDTIRTYTSNYLSNIKLESEDKTEELFSEISKSIALKELEDEMTSRLFDTGNPPTKKEIEDLMIRYQKLSVNEKINFNQTLKDKLDEAYYLLFTSDYKYKDSPSGEANEIEMYGIISRTSAGQDPVKLKVDRIFDLETINKLQGMINSNAGGQVEFPSQEKIFAPYDISLVKQDDTPVTVINPSEKVLCKIELPKSYNGKLLNIYHKIDDLTIERIDSKYTQLLGNKYYVYFECDSFSPYFMTSDALSIKATLDPLSTEGIVTPLGLLSVASGSSQVFNFTKEGTTNRVDILLYALNASNEFELLAGIDPINLFNKTTYTLANITSNMFITFKLSHDDNFKQSGGGSSGGGGGGGSAKPVEPVQPIEPVLPVEPIVENEYDFVAYMKGYEDGTFGPQLNMTRAEAATIISRISKDFSEEENYVKDSQGYKDYDSKHWANNYIGYVTKNEIMCGDDEGFRPDDSITRGEFSKLIYKLLNLEYANLAIVKTFSDCEGQFYETYANALYSAGILTGYEDGTFKGNGKLTRTEAAIMINKATGRGLNKEETLKAIKESKDFKEFKDVGSNRWFYLDDMMATVSYSLETKTDDNTLLTEAN